MDIKKELTPSSGDILHAGLKTAISSVPIVGGFASELFGLYIASPSEKRKENILIMIDDRLRELEKKVTNFHSIMMERNDNFVSITLQATQIAIRTHQQDKISVLINAITNSVIDTSVDESVQQMFLSFIDSFNEWHLRLILFLDNPKSCCESKGIKTDIMMGSLSDILYHYYPELASKKDFTKQLITDLSYRGLLNSDSSILNAMITGSGITASRTSDLGKQFISFIRSPEILNL
jgi:hypothetical protein